MFTKAQYDEIWGELRATENFWQSLKPLPGTSGLRFLPKHIEPVFVTARLSTAGQSVHNQTCAWLRNWFYITFPFVIVVEQPSEKIPLCKNLGLENFIDDKRSTILQMHDAGLRSYAKLTPSNSAEPFPEGIVPVETLDEFLKMEVGLAR